MKYSFAVAAAFGASVMGQASVVINAFSAIQSATSTLDTGIKGFSGGSTTSLESQASAVIDAINSGNSAVSGIATLSETDALSLITPINSLSGVVGTTIDDTISQKSVFDANNDGYLILQTLNAINSATETFTATVIGKVPTSLQSEASTLAMPIEADLQKGISAYQGEVPPTSSSSSSSSSSTATSSSTSTSTGVTTTVSSSTVTTTSGSSTITSTGSSTLTTTTTGKVTITPITNSTTTVGHFTGAAMPTAVAAYGAVVLAAMGGVAAAL